MNRIKTISILCALLIVSCGPSIENRYPSYERTIAKYAPPGEYEGVRLADSSHAPHSPGCDCPRIWYHGHWVYYHGGRWVYWDHGYWYHYPYFYIHYHRGVPYAYRSRARSITTGESSRKSGRRLRHAAPVDSDRDERTHRSKSDRPAPRRRTISK